MSDSGPSVARAEGGARSFDVCPSPVFIIGSPRSGTSILAWSLATHSELWTSAESDILFYLFGEGRFEEAFNRTMARPDNAWLRQEGVDQAELLMHVGLGLNALFTSRSGGKRWIDQTPVYTLITDLLAEMFPGAYFLHIIRDGRWVVHSMINMASAFPNATTFEEMRKAERLPPWATDFRDACRTWSQFVTRANAFTMHHPDRALTVVNERLVADPVRGFREILTFLGAGYEDGPSRFFSSNRINSSFARDYKGSITGPEIMSPWESWTVDQRLTFLEESGQTLVDLGFVAEGELGTSANRLKRG